MSTGSCHTPVGSHAVASIWTPIALTAKLYAMSGRGRRKLSTIGKSSTQFGQQTIFYTVKRSPRAKYARLEVRPGTGLTVVIPRSYGVEQVSALVEQKGQWILRKLAEYAQSQETFPTRALRSGDVVLYLGRDVEIVVQQGNSRAGSVKLEQGRLAISPGAEDGKLGLLLERWYRQQADNLIRIRADELCATLNVAYKRLTVRGARTRWGSCSQKGNVSFNWKLMMMPDPVIDYVIIHELCHLKQMDHSKRFWGMVAEHCPRWREHRKWLRDHESQLVAQLPT